MLEFTPENVNTVVNTIQVICKGYSIRLIPEKYHTPENPMRGHCIHASEALILLFPNTELQLYRAPCKHSDYHWWTQYNETIIDATADQYYSQGLNPPYEQGKLQTRTYGRDADWNDRYLAKSYFVRDKVIEYLTCSQLF